MCLASFSKMVLTVSHVAPFEFIIFCEVLDVSIADLNEFLTYCVLNNADAGYQSFVRYAYWNFSCQYMFFIFSLENGNFLFFMKSSLSFLLMP